MFFFRSLSFSSSPLSLPLSLFHSFSFSQSLSLSPSPSLFHSLSLFLSLSLSLIFHPHSLPISSLPFSLLMSTSLSFYTKIPFIKHLLHSPLMKALVDGLLRARKLRSQIEIYQHYRKMGIRTLDQARQYEGLSLCNRQIGRQKSRGRGIE